MKKRVLALLLCTVLLFSGLPVTSFVSDFAVTASAEGVSVEALQALYDSIPAKGKWESLFVDSETLALWYDMATQVLASPDDNKQEYIDKIETSLRIAYNSIQYHTQKVAITNTTVNLNVNSSYALKVTLEPENAADSVSWSSSNSSVVSVSPSGEIAAKKYSKDPVIITATSNGFSDTCKVYVFNPLKGVSISGVTSLYEGRTSTFKAVLTGEDSSAATTDDCVFTWDSSDTSVADVSDSGVVTAKKKGTTVITVTAESINGRFSASSNLRVDDIIEITSLKATTVTTSGKLLMNIDESLDFKVSINPTNASIKNLKWSSSDTSVLTVTDKGYSGSTAIASVTAKKAGTVKLKYTAQDGSGVSGYVTVTVQPRISSISIEKNKVISLSNKTETIAVTILPKDAGNQVLTWSSSNTDICDVDYSGRLIPKSLGLCTIYVKTTDGSNLSGECKVRVASLAASVSINKSTYTLNTKQTVTLKATVVTNDGSKYTDPVEWTSENPKVATVDSNGKVTALYPGKTIIRARTIDGTEKSVVCAVTVNQPVEGVAIAEKKTLGVGQSYTHKVGFTPSYATNKSLTWSSSNPSVATVSSSGTVTGKKVGTAVITCKTVDGGYTAKCTYTIIIATTSVALNKTKASVNVGKTYTLVGTVSPSNATNKTLKWSSSDTSVAKVSSSGVVTGVMGGTCTITCTNSGGQSAFCKITVIEKVSGITLNKSSLALYTGKTYTLKPTVLPSTATNKNVSWSSSNSKVASVSSGGVVTGVSAGTAVIIAATEDGGFLAKCSVTVTKKVDVTAVKLNKTKINLNKGGQYLLDATVSPSNASEKGITWSSNNTKVATVSSSGLVTAVGNGAAVITAKTKDGGFTAKCTVNVSSQVTGIRISPTECDLAKGKSKTLTVNVFPTDASNKSVVWKSSNTKVVTVSSKGVVTGVGSGTATVTATTVDGGYSASCDITVYISVTGVQLSSTEATVAKGNTILLTSKVSPSNASNNSVRWSSSDSSVVTVNTAGQITGKKVGTAVITVSTVQGNYSDTCVVTVVQLAQKVELDYTSLTLYAGKTKTLGAKLKPSTTTNQKIIWTSSDKSVATVNSKGQITAVAGGKATIKATSGDKQTASTCTVTVLQNPTKIKLNRTQGLLRVGATGKLTATVLPKTATDKSVTWKSANTKIVKVGADGTVKGIAKGTTTVTAYTANGQVKASCTITVIKSVTGVSLSYGSVSLNAGKKLTLKASVKPSDAYYQQVTWKSSNYDVADVSQEGTVTAKKPGYAEITATTKDGGYKAVCQVLVIQPVTSVSLNVKEAYIEAGSSGTIKATVKPSNATDKSVVWSSSDKSVVKVDSNGKVVGIKVGTATITAKTVSGSKVATCKIHVVRKVKSITLNKSEGVLYLNKTATLKAYIAPSDATVQTVKWSSSNTSVLRVSDKGLLTPVKPGKAVITATTVDGGLKATCTVSVEIPATSLKISQSSLTLYSGKTASLTATISPSNTTNKTVKWTSSNEKVATVSSAGKITAIGGGKATITAKTSNGLTKTCTVTVLKSVSGVSLNKTEASVYTGASLTLTATVLPSDASNKKVTWSTSNKNVATVDETGHVKAIKAGTAVITVTTADGSFKATCRLTVLQHVTSVTLDQTSLVLARGEQAKLTATVLPSDASDKTVSWESSDPEVVTVSVSGEIVARSVGEAVVSAVAEDGGKKASCIINVYESVTGIALDISEKILYIGESVEVTAAVSPSDASNRSVSWQSSNPAVANVDSDGKITALKVGTATVTAKTADGGFTDSCDITVRAHVSDIKLSDTTITVSRGKTYVLSASVIPDNSFDKSVIWKSENEQVATVENGTVTAVKKGETVITVTSVDGGLTASCQVSVTEPVTGISLSSQELTIYTGQSASLTAVVVPDDASDKRVTFTSSDENVAEVDGQGVVRGIGGGTALISAETADGNFVAVCHVTVRVSAETIGLDKTNVTLARGEKTTVVPTVLPENTFNKNVTWLSRNEEIASVDENGVITAVKAGKTTIVCRSVIGEASAEVDVEVYEPVSEIVVSGEKKELWVGEKLTLTALVKPEDATDRNVIWKSDKQQVASVENGVVTALSSGTVTITAYSSDEKVNGAFTLSVKQQVTQIELDTESVTLNESGVILLGASVVPENAADKTVLWSSTDEKVAVVDQTGKITAVGKGECRILASSADGFAESECSVTVIRPVTSVNISNKQLSLEKGDEFTLTASAYPVDASDATITWTSSNPEVCPVTQNGTLTAKKGGKAVITAQSSNKDVYAECTITVEVTSTDLKLDISQIELWENETVTVSASLSPEDVTDTSVKWTSSNDAVASVENGKITAVAVGTAVITATANDSGKSASCTVKVSRKTEKVVLDHTELTLENGESFTLTARVLPEDATYQTVSFTTSDKNVAVVDESGTVTAKGAGTALITVSTDEGGNKAVCSVTVTQKPTSISLSETSLTLTEGQSGQLTVSFLPLSTTEKELIWETSDEKIATVKDGVITAISLGKAVITATSAEDSRVLARCEVIVLRAAGSVTLDQNEMTLTVGAEEKLTAVVGPDGASNQNVTWSTSDETVAVVDENGLVQAIGEGTALITVTTEDGGFADVCFVSVEKTQQVDSE